MENYYVSDIKDYLFKEETPWYQDWYILCGILIFLICIGGLTYSNWDSDSNIKENIQSMGSNIFNIIKEIKNKIINFFNIRRNQGRDDNSDDSTSETESYFKDEMDLSRVDSRILSDPYLYPFFKHLHKKEDWPMYGSSEHATMVTETFNPSSKKLIHTYEHISNLYDSIVKMADNNTMLPGSMVDKFQGIMDKASEEYYTWKNFNDANLPPVDTTPKASTSLLPDTTPKASTSTLPENNKLEEFSSNLKGKFKENKSIFESLRNRDQNLSETNKESNSLLDKTVEIIKSADEFVNDNALDQTLFKDTAYDLEIGNENNVSTPPAPPAPPIPSTSTLENNNQTSSNSLLASINSFSKNKLKKATTITKKEFDRQGNIINVVTESSGEDDNPLDIIPNLSTPSIINDINDLKSDIWKRTFRSEGFNLNDDGTISKKESTSSSKVIDNNPLTLALSTQLDKMIVNETASDEIKVAPSWDENITNVKNENEFNESNNSTNEKEKLKAKKGITLKLDKKTWKNLPEDFKNAKLPPKGALTEFQEAIVQDFDKSLEMYKLQDSIKKFDKNKLNEVEDND